MLAGSITGRAHDGQDIKGRAGECAGGGACEYGDHAQAAAEAGPGAHAGHAAAAAGSRPPPRRPQARLGPLAFTQASFMPADRGRGNGQLCLLKPNAALGEVTRVVQWGQAALFAEAKCCAKGGHGCCPGRTYWWAIIKAAYGGPGVYCVVALKMVYHTR